MQELSLVFFTVLAQGTVGLFLVLACLLMANSETNRQQLLNKLLMVVLVLLGIAGAAAMTHLGQPLHAINVIFGLQHLSALSVEIMTTALFGGAVFTYVAMVHFGILAKLQKLVLAGAMGLGVLLLLAIANVYTLATVPAWNSGWTIFQFVMTAFVVGIPAAALMLRSQSATLGAFQKAYQERVDRALATLGFITLGLVLVCYPLYLFWLGQVDLPANPLGLFDYHGSLMLARLGLLFAGLGIWVIAATRGNNSAVGLAAVSTVLVLTAELCGRIFFYDLHLLPM
ncbi:DmsC/YnfH family molybdoenzyme membrane anchor subunit [Endozoicomonas sp. SCSIO W0465]|uniref:dimethyl sulfoxide reductase anchor subunit family protein n=1 Tax=Endozoicomonas sp. SCSIO W0465 TaxID=2918516 RepID=UPI002074F07F|nr:DmsC/YnfH family molybdoenzyme membrane anchor subunit [Endozoicomonas sp. SCSIO W0465]USE36459.1 dimethyl sulfoxide reductase anchor subunit [Endozoicomonas sp. SCSIO W0465]